MKYLVIADVHYDHSHKLRLLKPFSEGIDGIIFCGDGLNTIYSYIKSINFPFDKFYYVKGNCDYSSCENEIIVNAGNNKIFVTHGHEYRVKQTVDLLIDKAFNEDCSVALFGHTHSFEEGYRYGIYYLNPGAFDNTYDKASFAYLIIDNDGARSIKINI